MDNIDLIKLMLSRPVSFHRALVPVAGSVAGAVWLGQLLYWSEGRGKDPNGWIYKTQEEWERETCLSADAQRTVRKFCKKNGVISEELKGIPARIYYRINLEILAEILAKNKNKPDTCPVVAIGNNKVRGRATARNWETPHLYT